MSITTWLSQTLDHMQSILLNPLYISFDFVLFGFFFFVFLLLVRTFMTTTNISQQYLTFRSYISRFGRKWDNILLLVM